MRRSQATTLVSDYEASAISIGAVPVLVDSEELVSAIDGTLVGHIDGLRTVGEIARRVQLPVAHVRALLFELAGARAIVIDDDPEAEAMPLVRLKERSPLVRAILALIGRG